MKAISPHKINADIKLIIQALQLDAQRMQYLKLIKQNDFEAIESYCHINCLKIQELYGGRIQFGWVIWQDLSAYFTEAEFHSVWVNNQGRFFDITPRTGHDDRILFIPDHIRAPEIIQIDHLLKIKSFSNYKMLNGEELEGLKPFEHFLEADKLDRIGLRF